MKITHQISDPSQYRGVPCFLVCPTFITPLLPG